MTKKNICKKCGEQYHMNWLDVAKQAKLDAVAEVLQRTKTTIIQKSKAENKEETIRVALDAINEVKKVYEATEGATILKDN